MSLEKNCIDEFKKQNIWSSDEKEFHKKFKKWALLHHPDKNPGDYDQELFKTISSCRDSISNFESFKKNDSGSDFTSYSQSNSSKSTASSSSYSQPQPQPQQRPSPQPQPQQRPSPQPQPPQPQRPSAPQPQPQPQRPSGLRAGLRTPSIPPLRRPTPFTTYIPKPDTQYYTQQNHGESNYDEWDDDDYDDEPEQPQTSNLQSELDRAFIAKGIFWQSGNNLYFTSSSGMHYKILKRIGSESVNGSVYLVRDKGNTNKALKLTVLDNEQKRLFFDNCVNVHNVFNRAPPESAAKYTLKAYASGIKLLAVPQIGYIVEEYLDGYMDFEMYCKKLVQEFPNLLEQRLKDIILKIGHVLLRLYNEFGFNHNDLHLRNVMVRHDPLDIKLIDFDWATFYKSGIPISSAQQQVMNQLYFPNVSRITGEVVRRFGVNLNDLRCDLRTMNGPCMRSIEQRVLQSLSPCDFLHYIIHMFYSLEYYSQNKASPSVDMAKFCIDLEKKFLGRGNCREYDTTFDVNSPAVVQIRNTLRGATQLKALLKHLENNRYSLNTNSPMAGGENRRLRLNKNGKQLRDYLKSKLRQNQSKKVK